MSRRLRDPRTLVASYPLNNHAQDISGHGLHGIWTGTEAYAAFLKNSRQAGDFAGANDYITLPFAAASHMNGQTAWSVALWFLADALQGTLFSFEDGLNDGVYIDHLDGVEVRVNTVASISASVKVGTWTHVVAVKEAAGLQSLYINGDLADTDDSSAETVAVTGDPLLGVHEDLSGDLNGREADVRLYSCALTNDEILKLFHAPVPTY